MRVSDEKLREYLETPQVTGYWGDALAHDLLDARAALAASEAKLAEARKALEQVESVIHIDHVERCPWCGSCEWDDRILIHKGDCLRQRGLGLAAAREGEPGERT